MCSLLTNFFTVNLFHLCVRLSFHISVGRGVSFEMEVRLKTRFRLAGNAGRNREVSTMAKRFKRRAKPKTRNGNHTQNWKTYNLIQTMEKFRFPQILRMLCAFVAEP